MVGRWYQGGGGERAVPPLWLTLLPEQSTASTQLMKSSCSDSTHVVADQEKTHGGLGSAEKVIFVQPFPFRTTGSPWPITIVIIKSSLLQVQDIKVDNVSIIF